MKRRILPMASLFSTTFSATRMLALFGAMLATVSLAQAQNLFAPAVYVNETAVTNYELQQRERLLEVLGTSGDLRAQALERLVNERLQVQAAEFAGVELSAQDITDGVEEFAGRADQSGPEFLTSLGAQGIDADSFRDFVRSGLAWRNLVRARFANKTGITDAEIDRAISLAGTKGSAEVLISEIFLPTNTPENIEVTKQLAPQIAQLRTVAEFSDAARRFSAGPSRSRGGIVPNWVPIDNLPPPIRAAILTMKPGQVSEPIEIPNAVALFQLRALRETVGVSAPNPLIDYAIYYIDGGQSPAAIDRARHLRDDIDSCDDLYGVAQNQPPEMLERIEQPLNDIPADIALELAKLDENEASTALTRSDGNTLVFLMLCGRTGNDGVPPARESVRNSLANQKLSGLADAYLDELRANATIRFP